LTELDNPTPLQSAALGRMMNEWSSRWCPQEWTHSLLTARRMLTPTHPCGCKLARGTQEPCQDGKLLWDAVKATYDAALETGDWRPVAEARTAVYAHYGQVPWSCDAYVCNMELDTFNKLQNACWSQLERWIGRGGEYAAHARIAWGLRFAKDYPER